MNTIFLLSIFCSLTYASLYSASVTSNGHELTIICSSEDEANSLVYWVDFPRDIVSPPNNTAYSAACITKDGFIWLSGLTGLDLNGNPVSAEYHNHQNEIIQAYRNLVNVLDYLQVPLTYVLKLDVLIEGGHGEFEERRAQANIAENHFWGENNRKPPRTIAGVRALNKSMFEVSAVVKNPYPLNVVVSP